MSKSPQTKKTATLKSERRSSKGTRPARALRAQGRIPAALLADTANPAVEFHFDRTEFITARRHHIHLFELDFSGNVETALVRELQWDTYGEQILHVEFRRVRLDVETEAEVELEFTGHPKTGMLNHLVTHVTVRCLPAAIPDSIEVTVGHLEPGIEILASELKMPEGVKLAIPADTTIAVGVLAKILELEPAAAVPAEGEAVAVEGEEAAPEAAAKAAKEPAVAKEKEKGKGKEKD